MEKNLYIDALHPNETRVVLKSEDNIEIDASPDTFSNFNEVLINIFKNNNAEDISALLEGLRKAVVA